MTRYQKPGLLEVNYYSGESNTNPVSMRLLEVNLIIKQDWVAPTRLDLLEVFGAFL